MALALRTYAARQRLIHLWFDAETPAGRAMMESSSLTEDDLPAVVHLAIMVERQHETYWPLRWKLREGLPEGYLRWMTRRIDDPKRLRNEIAAWQRRRNKTRASIKWMFTTDKARAKLGRAYPATAKESKSL